jgi:hypothetical protein
MAIWTHTAVKSTNSPSIFFYISCNGVRSVQFSVVWLTVEVCVIQCIQPSEVRTSLLGLGSVRGGAIDYAGLDRSAKAHCSLFWMLIFNMLHRKSLILIRLFRTRYWLVWMLRASSAGCCRTFLRRCVGFVIKGQTAQLSLHSPFWPLKMRPTPLLRNVPYQSFSDAMHIPEKNRLFYNVPLRRVRATIVAVEKH